MNRLLGAACVLTLAGLAGCAAITPVPPGPVAMGERHQVVLNREWSDVSVLVPQRNKKVRVLSIDGPLLNRLYITSGLTSGEGLLTSASKEHPAPTFHADMAPTELVEFVADSISAAGYQRVETSRLRPAKVAGTNALRFDIAAKTESGLEMSGTAATAVLDDKLYVVLYLAPSEHYYAANLPDVEAALNSIS